MWARDIGRDQVARLMKAGGIEGVRRTKRVRTTKPDPGMPRHPDLVRRDFTATAPNQLWVTDLTFVPTWAGVAYVCFIIDAFSRTIVGWRVGSHMRTTMVLDAVEMARWSRGTQLTGLRCHSDAGSQFTSIRYGEHLAEIGAVPSIGTVADSGDNAAEYETIAAAAQRDRWASLVRTSGLTVEQAQAAIESEAFGPLTAELRRAEANHHDIETLLPRLVRARGFDDADDIAAVIRYRVSLATARPAGSGRARRAPRLIAGLIPHADEVHDTEMRTALDERAKLIEARTDAVVDRALTDKAP